MSKSKVLSTVAKDLHKVMKANGEVLESITWEKSRDKVRKYLHASKNTKNWISGMIYRKEKGKKEQQWSRTEHHRKFLVKLKRIFSKNRATQPSPAIKDQLKKVNQMLNEQ